MVNIIVVTHGEFGAYLIEAAEGIVGAQEGGVRAVCISARLSMEEVRERLAEAVRELDSADGIVIATDMPGGTPCNIAMPLVKDMERVRVISGVNLYMLVAGFGARRQVGVEELAEKMLACGRKAIADIKAAFLSKTA